MVIVEHRNRTPLTGRALKVTIMLDSAALLQQPAPEGKPRVTLQIHTPDRIVTADIAAKLLRRAQATIKEAGAEAVAVILQGKLMAGDVINEAGLSAQPKLKPQAPSNTE